jgi:NADH-quinone oxidoreductase subunit F
MPANADELEGALEEGIALVCMAQPLKVVEADGAVRALEVMRMKAGSIDTSGRPTPLPTGESYEIPCDTLVIAVGERVDAAGLESVGAAIARDGRVGVDPFRFITANPKFFAAGDAVTGPATAAEAMGQAKTAAAAIDAALMPVETAAAAGAATSRFEGLFRKFEYAMEVPLSPAKAKMNRARQLPLKERHGNFVEISQGFTGEQARFEAERCLRCDVREHARKHIGIPDAKASVAKTSADKASAGRSS